MVERSVVTQRTHNICSINAGFKSSHLHPLTRLSYYIILPILRTSHLPSKMPVSQCTLLELLVLIIIAGSYITIVVAVCQSCKRGLRNMSKASIYLEHDTNPFLIRLTFTNILDNVHAVSHSLALTPLGFAPQKTGDGRDRVEGIRVRPLNSFHVAENFFLLLNT